MEPKYGGDEGHPLIILWQCAWMLRGLTLHWVGMASLMMAQLAIPPPPRNFLPIPKVFFGCLGDRGDEMHAQLKGWCIKFLFDGRNPAPVDIFNDAIAWRVSYMSAGLQVFFHQYCFRIHAPEDPLTMSFQNPGCHRSNQPYDMWMGFGDLQSRKTGFLMIPSLL